MPTVYTAIFGKYDDLKDPRVITPGWKYICFTDDPEMKSDIWEVVQCPVLPEGARRTSKLYKIKFYQFIQDDISIYVDGSFVINCDLDQWVKRLRGSFTLMQHPTRSCVYKEAEACIKHKRDNPDIISKHTSRYRRAGLPANNGMAASGIMIRERTIETIAFSDLWYDELCNGCCRDQISYAYAAWKHPITHLTDYNYRTGTDFLGIPHMKHTDRRKAKINHYKKMGLL